MGAAPQRAFAATSAPLARLCPIAAGNSWLASCLSDLGFEPSCIERVVPPGTCVGQFDIRPGDAARLRRARASVFFDFQQSLAQRLTGSVLVEAPVLIAPRGGLCVPSTYGAAARELAAALSTREPDTSSVFMQRLGRLDERLRGLEHDMRARIAATGWQGRPVVASVHQAAFCRWLGLDVAATLPPADSATPAEVQDVLARARQAHAVAVVANEEEGTQAARSVADALGVPVVVLHNFPALTREEPDFEALVRGNVARLAHASKGERP
jgi:ABC-type Zn uptake system ZnuABC Zn-binding protein ZnuA